MFLSHARIQSGGQGPGPPPPPEKSQKFRVSWQYWSGFPEKSQVPSQHPMLGHHRRPVFSGIWILSSTKKKEAVKVGPPLTKLSGSAHVRHYSDGKVSNVVFCWFTIYCNKIRINKIICQLGFLHAFFVVW